MNGTISALAAYIYTAAGWGFYWPVESFEI
jgi:hypothetical protein